MKALLAAVAAFSFLTAVPLASAQGIQVNRENRTVAVSASGAVEVEPEIALVHIGYSNYGKTQDATYDDNMRTASKIIAGLLAAGLKQADIVTQDVRLHRVDSREENLPPQERKEQQFEAEQTWNVSVPPAEAQSLVDRAVAAGANEMEGVTWEVADPRALDARAAAVALTNAHALAEQMAKQFGGKVGELLFVSNTQPGSVAWLGGPAYQTVTVEAALRPSLKLFPQKVRRDVTVYAAFALE